MTDGLEIDPSTLGSPEHLCDPQQALGQFATALRKFHEQRHPPGVDLAGTGLPTRSPGKLADTATEKLRSGVVSALPAPYDHASIETLVQTLTIGVERITAPVEDLVDLVGLATMSNAVVGAGGDVSWGDLSKRGRGDRYLDLAVAATDVANQVGPGAVLVFFDAYGMERPDPSRLDFYALCAAVLSAESAR